MILDNPRFRARRLVYLTPVLLIGLPAFAFAQGRGDPAAIQERIDQEIDGIITELDLNEDEAEVTRTVLEHSAQERIEAMREMRSGGARPDRQLMRERMEEIDLTTEELLAEFLSEEKMQAFRTYREQRRAEARAQRGQRQRQRQGGGP